jgi:hypothetical protein
MDTWLGKNIYPPSVRVFYISECLASLIATDRYPSWDQVKKIFSATGVVEYTPKDVATRISNLFNSFVQIEDLLWVLQVDGSLAVSPDYLMDRLTVTVARQLRNCLAKIAVQKKIGDSSLADLCVASVAGRDAEARHVALQGSVTHLEHSGAASQLPDLPIQLDCLLLLLYGSEDVLREIDWQTLWQYPDWAILKAYYSGLPRTERTAHALIQYRFGDRFVETLLSLDIHSQPGRLRSVYETCALVACGYASRLAGINPRRLRGANRPSDGSHGMRADISQYGAGYRLHYWKTPEGIIEFSCVNVHNDVCIY